MAIEAIDRRLAELAADFQKAETNLHRALTRAGDCEAAYREASDRMRRQFNLTFFKRLLIDDDCTVTGELAPPFDVLLGEELRQAVVARTNDELLDAIAAAERQRVSENTVDEHEQRPQELDAPVGVGVVSTPRSSGGWNPKILVRPSGLEPPPRLHRTRPSTLRVYQFRHGRRGASIAVG